MRAVNLTTLAALIAAVASLIAAGLSVWSATRAARISAGLTAQLADNSKRQDWWRENVLPLVADLLATADALQDTMQVYMVPERPEMERLRVRFALRPILLKADNTVAQLELVASPAVHDAAQKFRGRLVMKYLVLLHEARYLPPRKTGGLTRCAMGL